MRCRLCLKQNLDEIDVLFTYNDDGCVVAHNLLELISKYLNLHIAVDDSISTLVCQDCYDHLVDFDKFVQYISEQQKVLFNEFLEVTKIEETQVEDAVQDPLVSVECLTEIKEELMNNLTAVKEEEEETEETTQNQLELNDLHSNKSFCSEDEKPLVQKKVKKKKKKTKTLIKHKKRKMKTDDEDEDAEENDDVRPKIIETKNREMIAKFMKLICDICSIEVKDFRELRQHFNEEHQQRAYMKCCGKKMYRLDLLATHVDRHQNPEKYTCQICQKQFKTDKYLEVHLLLHGKKSNTACEKCKRVFRSNKLLNNHLRKNICVQEVQCQQCDKRFSDKFRLRTHVSAVHDNFCPHVCESCGKKFKLKASLERHALLYHQGVVETPEQCKVCGNWLKSQHSLRIHMYRHEIKESACAYCERTFSTTATLRRHINYMHLNPKNIKCSFCDKTFRFSKELKEHLAVHTGIQLYNCTYCTKEFRSSANMYSHTKRMHKEEWLKSKMERSHNPYLNNTV